MQDSPDLTLRGRKLDLLPPKSKNNDVTTIDYILPNVKTGKSLPASNIQRDIGVLPIHKSHWVVDKNDRDDDTTWTSKSTIDKPAKETPPSTSQPSTKEETNQSAANITNQDNIIKSKLFAMIKEAKALADRHVWRIEKVHETYNNYKLYKIGYIVSYINKTHDNLTDLFNYVQANIDNWGALKTLNYYEQVKKANDFLSDTLKILDLVTSSNKPILLNAPPSTETDTRVGSNADDVAWSYNDEFTE